MAKIATKHPGHSAQINPRHGRIPEFNLGDRMTKARETAGISQIAMAEELGLTRNAVGNYESMRTPVRRHILIIWAQLTGVDFDWLETGVTGNDLVSADTGIAPVNAESAALMDGADGVAPPVGLEPTTLRLTACPGEWAFASCHCDFCHPALGDGFRQDKSAAWALAA